MRFSVSTFMLKSFIHFDVGFVQDGKYESTFILQCVDVQLDLGHLFKMLSVFHCMVWTSSSKIKCDRFVGVFWVFDLIPSINVSVSVLVPGSIVCLFIFMLLFYHYYSDIQLEVWDCNFSWKSFIVQECFGFHGFYFSKLHL